MSKNILLYYPNNQNSEELSVIRKDSLPINIKINEWGKNKRSWEVNSNGKYKFLISGLEPNSSYRLTVNGNRIKTYNSNSAGIISFEHASQISTSFIIGN